MKSAVLAAIAGAETQRTPVPQAPRQVERSRSLGEILHTLMLRPLPVAAAVAVLVIGTLAVSYTHLLQGGGQWGYTVRVMTSDGTPIEL